MIPSGGTIRSGSVQASRQPSRTWKIDFERGKVVGMTDGLDAVKQAVYCILKTDRYRHLIYSYNYGNEFPGLIGKSSALIRSEVTRLLHEALLQDDRISEIQNIQVEANGSELTIRFVVAADIGSFSEEVVVNERISDV